MAARKIKGDSPFAGIDAYTLRDIGAIKALARDPKHKRALTYIVEILGAVYDQSYRPDSDRDTAFIEGRRFVGLQIIKLMNFDTQLLKKRKSDGRSRHRDDTPTEQPSDAPARR